MEGGKKRGNGKKESGVCEGWPANAVIVCGKIAG